MVAISDLLDDKRIYDVTVHFFVSLLYETNLKNSMLPSVRSVIDHRRCQNVVRLTSVKHSPDGLCTTSLFLPHFDVIFDLL